MEKLKLQQVQEIVYRLSKDQSERSVATDLHLARDTVRRYARIARACGYLSEGAPLPSLEELEVTMAPHFAERRSNVSTVAPFKSVVECLLAKKVETQAIHRRLVRSHGYKGSYSSVRRFIKGIRPSVPEAVVRIETKPGEEIQVDFGTVVKMLDPVTKVMRTAYCFVMTFCWSRHMYVRFVFKQNMPTWLECHRQAFEAFGGVPLMAVIDNLKAAVLKATLNNPVLSVPYARFARHYGFLVHACRPATPEHKGKVESGVHYVKRNFIASEEFIDINDANKKVAAWVSEEAGLRMHGTTYERPMERFIATERDALQSLPATPYDLEAVIPAKLHRDCHVQAADGFYSAPYTYIGQVLLVYLFPQVVQIFDGTTLLTTHERAAFKGDRKTRQEHYPPGKSLYMLRTRLWCQERASVIGPRCREIVDYLLADGPLDRLRAVQGIVGMADKWSADRVEAACERSLHFGDPSCQRVRSILKAGTDKEPIETVVQLKLVNFTYARGASEFFTAEEAGWSTLRPGLQSPGRQSSGDHTLALGQEARL
jgi:transposase